MIRLEQANVRAIIFDYDGVLAHSVDNSSGAVLYNLYRAQSADDPLHMRKVYELLKNRELGSADWISELKEKAGIDINDRKILKEISDRLFRISKFTQARFCWVERVIPPLAERVPLAICSNNCRKAVEYAMSTLLEHFSAIVTYEDVKKLKPDREGLLLISKILGVPPEETLFVGDSMEDVFAGNAAGMLMACPTWSLKGRFGHYPKKGNSIIELSNPELLLRLVSKIKK